MGGGGMAPPGPQYNMLVEPYVHYDLNKRLASLESEVKELRAATQSGRDLERWLEKALTYQTAVMAIAYAGFFVLWEKVEGVGPDIIHASAGILMGLSISVFIVWTLLQMNAVHQALVGQTPKPDPEALNRAGPSVFMFSAVTGLSAAAAVLLLWVIRFLN